MNRSEKLKQVLSVLNIAFYRFVDLNDLPELKQSFRKSCLELQLKGTVLLSREGINGSLAGSVPNVRKFQEFLNENNVFLGLDFKESYSDFVPYRRMLVKVKKEI